MAKNQPEAPKTTDVLVVKLDKKLVTWQARVEDALDVANRLTVDNDETLAQTADIRKGIRELNKEIDAETSTILSPLKQLLELMKGKIKPITVTGEQAEKIIKEKVEVYLQAKQQAIEKVRAEEEAKRQADLKRQQEEQKKRAAEAVVAGKPIPNAPEPQEPPPPIELPKATEKIYTDKGASVGGRTVWQYEIVDANAIPRNYLIPNEKLIGANVRAGVREIPGIRIYSKIIAV